MKMALLLIGWNLTLAGLLLIPLTLMERGWVFPTSGIGILSIGLFLSIALRKTCPNLRSDPIEETKDDKPLDYY
jgi:hypothetical protein